MVNNNASDDLICWTPNGDSFIVQEPKRFEQEVLCNFFKHKKYSSFVRQLHNYGFYKIRYLQQGALHSSSTIECEHYAHIDSQFRRDRRDLLTHIQRKSRTAPDHPVQFTKVGEDSRGQSLEAICLDVANLKGRQTELETENKSLRDTVGTLERQVEFMLRLLDSLGLLPMAGHYRTVKGNDQLMIQGMPGKVEAGQATGLDEPMDSCGLSDTLSSLPRAHFAEAKGPIPSDNAHPSLPSSPSSFVGGPYKSTSCPEFTSGNDSPLCSNDPGHSNQAHFQEGLTDPLFPSDPSTETDSYNFDAYNTQYVDPPVESFNDFKQNHCVDENNVRSSYPIPSSLPGSSSGAVTGSDMPTTSGIPEAFSSPIVQPRRQKESARAMDELERAWAQRALIHPLPLPPFPSDIHPAAEATFPESLPQILPHDQHLLPNHHLIPGYTIPGFESDSRPTKRARYT